MKTTVSIRTEDADRSWWVLDLEGKILGRAAVRVASMLRGKHKPTFTPHADTGDFVVVVNAGKVRLTGRKLQQKMYYRHSGYIGGLRTVSAEKLLQSKPEEVFRLAVRGMLPRGPLGRKMLKKLKIFGGPEHIHQAQQPQPLELD